MKHERPWLERPWLFGSVLALVLVSTSVAAAVSVWWIGPCRSEASAQDIDEFAPGERCHQRDPQRQEALVSPSSPSTQSGTAELAARAGAGRDAAALQSLRLRAWRGDLNAQAALGEVLLDGSNQATGGAEGAEAEGLRWLRNAAQAGQPSAQTQLGLITWRGEHGVAGDAQAAKAWLEPAARSGEVNAAYALALVLRAQSPARDAEAMRWLQQAANAGHPAAMFVLGNALRNGEGIAIDEAAALARYRQSAELDYPPALQTLAMAYQRGELGLPRDPERFEEELMETAHALKHPPLMR